MEIHLNTAPAAGDARHLALFSITLLYHAMSYNDSIDTEHQNYN